MDNENLTRWQKWKASIAASTLQNDFLGKQVALHPDIQMSIYAMSLFEWYDLVGIHKKYRDLTDEEVDKIYKKAKWLTECDYIKILRCEKCGKVIYYCEAEDLDNEEYYDMVQAKNCLHVLEGGYGNYPSAVDMMKIELNLCDRCYCEAKNIKYDDTWTFQS